MLRFLAACLLASGLLAASAARADEASYCLHKGGVVELRTPTYGTNGSNALPLAGPRQFCRFTASDGSSIHLLLTTLTAAQPSLAALAYYAEVPFQGQNCQGSPGSCYCSQLGGTDLFGGINAAGGGWVLTKFTTDVLDACIFPDLSSIDSYGLFYHSAGIIRGIDLGRVLRYKNPY